LSAVRETRPPLPEDQPAREVRRHQASQKKKKKDAAKKRQIRKAKEREELKKRRRQQSLDGLPLEESPSETVSGEDDNDDDDSDGDDDALSWYDAALVSRHRDTLNVQIGQVTARFEALKNEVATLSGAVWERDEALLNARQEIETLRAAVRDRDGALQVLEKTCGGLRDEVVGWQTHSEGKFFVVQRPWCRGPRLVLT
jgi:chromosome segregation ATPase